MLVYCFSLVMLVQVTLPFGPNIKWLCQFASATILRSSNFTNSLKRLNEQLLSSHLLGLRIHIR